MANALTISALTENIFRARDKVARELVGFIPSVMINASGEGVSTGGTVNSFRTSEPTLGTTLTPAMTLPSGDDQTIGVETMTLGQAAVVKIPLAGEKILQLANTVGYDAALDAMIAQGLRVMVNAIEAHIAEVAYKGASRAYGTAGTAPFGSTPKLADAANMQKILDDNGAPMDGRTLVINTAAAVNLGSLTQLTNVGDAGTDDLLRRGVIADLFGFGIKKSAKVKTHTKGAGAGYDVDLTAGYAIGDTTIHLDGGTVNTTGIKAGDVVTFVGDSNKYVVETGTTAIEADIVLNRPGLRATLADTVEMTIGDSYTANVALQREAIELAIRPPALPQEGDAGDHQLIADDLSPLVFDAAIYKGYLMNVLHLSCVYQAKVWKPEFVATLLG